MTRLRHVTICSDLESTWLEMRLSKARLTNRDISALGGDPNDIKDAAVMVDSEMQARVEAGKKRRNKRQ